MIDDTLTTELPVHGIKQLYRYYVSEQQRRNEPYVGYFHYTETLRRFNNKLIEEILAGAIFSPGFQLGKILIIKQKRNFEHPTIDWGATRKLKAETGISQWVFFQDDYYYRWYWRKYTCKVPNRSVYAFAPSKGPGGAVLKLSRKLQQDEFASQQYLTKDQMCALDPQ